MKSVCILGATGSIGAQALDVISKSSETDKLVLAAFSFNRNYESASEIIRDYRPRFALTNDAESHKKLIDLVGENCFTKILPPNIKLEELCKMTDAKIVLSAISGTDAIRAAIETIKQKKILALANKETLVSAGDLVKNECIKHNGVIIPVDSEHSAIYQALAGIYGKNICYSSYLGKKNRIKSLILTASGGAFRDCSIQEISIKKASEALIHPNWNMGKKITVDSATMMNKGLELIEAMHLFNMSAKQIEIVIHRQSILHSAVKFLDGSILAQMGPADMRQPIAYALYDHMRNFNGNELDLIKLSKLTFEAPDLKKFPCLNIAINVANEGGILPVVMNSANEILVSEYLNNKIKFYDISYILEKTLDLFVNEKLENIEQMDNAIKLTNKNVKMLLEEL